MRRIATDEHPETEQVDPGRDLVIMSGSPQEPRCGWRVARRPDSGFLAQLIVSADPTLRASRIERTRSATARYAEMARRRA
ncbi:hypothetical protein G3T14_01310 [Methylobacterium sp. BTF04]|uniref:hypothetical protein n=1 Tax=Methylobacterium sp. BTF04 TaxID=2708300 RepID=UPI0013CFD6AF|nr:hypothetical protein [Methylobacterium sp. BTF04]NEU10769.1 hypothetical protein [Methylobacterium sp. BTF04]